MTLRDKKSGFSATSFFKSLPFVLQSVLFSFFQICGRFWTVRCRWTIRLNCCSLDYPLSVKSIVFFIIRFFQRIEWNRRPARRRTFAPLPSAQLQLGCALVLIGCRYQNWLSLACWKWSKNWCHQHEQVANSQHPYDHQVINWN